MTQSLTKATLTMKDRTPFNAIADPISKAIKDTHRSNKHARGSRETDIGDGSFGFFEQNGCGPVLVMIHEIYRMFAVLTCISKAIAAWSCYRWQEGIVQPENHTAIYMQHLLTADDRRNIYLPLWFRSLQHHDVLQIPVHDKSPKC